jgi:hypothetical protein
MLVRMSLKGQPITSWMTKISIMKARSLRHNAACFLKTRFFGRFNASGFIGIHRRKEALIYKFVGN